jgi:hypothetical protein
LPDILEELQPLPPTHSLTLATTIVKDWPSHGKGLAFTAVNISVVSGTLKKKKKYVEQSAAEMAIEKVLFISLSINYHYYFSYSLSGQ